MNETRWFVIHVAMLFCLPSGVATMAVSGELKYDFGPKGSRGADGCIQLGIGQPYSQETRRGFVPGGTGDAAGSRQRSGQTDPRLNSLVYHQHRRWYPTFFHPVTSSQSRQEFRSCRPTETHEEFLIRADEDCQALMTNLQHRGYGRPRPEGVRKQLEEMAANWQGPPSR